MSGAKVHSLDALVQFRAAVAAFQERALAAVGSLRQETLRTLLWLEQEQPHYWAEQVRRGFDRVAEARTAYESCRLRTVAGHRSACLEELQALRKAQQRLAYCQEQVEVVRRWSQRARDQADEFFGQLGPLERSLDQDLPRLLATLEQMLLALEAYLSIKTADSSSALNPDTNDQSAFEVMRPAVSASNSTDVTRTVQAPADLNAVDTVRINSQSEA